MNIEEPVIHADRCPVAADGVCSNLKVTRFFQKLCVSIGCIILLAFFNWLLYLTFDIDAKVTVAEERVHNEIEAVEKIVSNNTLKFSNELTAIKGKMAGIEREMKNFNENISRIFNTYELRPKRLPEVIEK